jgi:FkbH-like protein
VQFGEALKTIHEYSSADHLPPCRVLLVTGFNPLHLQTFFHAHLQRLLPTSRVRVSTGVYGDLAGTLARIQTSTLDMCAIALEWPDLDSRLGFRQLGGWGPRELADCVVSAQSKFLAIRSSLEAVPNHVALAVSLPTLALPPVFHIPSWQLGEPEMRLRHAAGEFALWAAGRPHIRFVNAPRPGMDVPSAQAFNFKAELLAGLPYAIFHADQVAQSLARLLVPPAPKKGLITDLDDTLWAGIAGEVGPEAVSWDLDSKTQLHGLYQQLLRALADQGVLIGVASKNDPEIVDAVFRRTDIVLPRDRVFPIEVHWSAKSESVAKILETWNVHGDSVVFVDDSSSELAEVKAAYPDMECIRFDGLDYAEVHSLLYRLRDLFAKQTITKEDDLRRESLRTGRVFREGAQRPGVSHETFLRDAEAIVTFDFAAATNSRSVELVNKTNQFNLNGTRYTETEWRGRLAMSNTFAVSASYRDKYGPLGVIAVLAGQADETSLTLDTWVMSCRAFGRRIEYQCLKAILDRFPVQEIRFAFSPTLRNEYLQEFSESLLGKRPDGPFRISRTVFLDKCPPLYHQVEICHE